MRNPRRRVRSEDGMSLVEMLVALSIASTVLLALAMVTIAGIRGTLMARQNQLAGDMVNQAIERVRALDFADVAMVTGDPTLAGDPRISFGKINPGTGTAEPLVYVSVGSLNPHMVTETHNGTVYSVWRYVTQPNGIATGTRRLTVFVTWTSGGTTHTRSSSTFVTATRRGLPLPRFLLQFSSPSAQTLGAGTTVTYGIRLKNYGARDAWNITGPSGTWSYVIDADKDGVLDSGETTPVTDTNGDGILDTGTIETNSEVFLLASTTVPSTIGSVSTYKWTLTSIAQPLAASASQSLTGTLTVSGTPLPPPVTPPSSGDPQSPYPLPVASCATSCTLKSEYLHDLPGGSHANTLSSSTNNGSLLGATIDGVGTLQSAAYNYSTNLGTGFGRYVKVGGVATSSATTMDYVADWRKSASSKINVQAGKAVATLYVACLSGSASSTIDVAIGTGGTMKLTDFTSKASGTATLTTCDGTYRPLVIPVTLSAFSVNRNSYLVVRATVRSGMPSDVRFGYDWAGAPSTVVIPQ